MRGTLLADALLASALALLYVYVGRLVHGRYVANADAARARDAFATWWLGLAAFTLLGSVKHAAAAFDLLDRGFFAALTFLSIAPLVAALWGLVYYLVYIYSGDARYYRAILVAHALLAVFLFGLVVWMHPLFVTATDWQVTIHYEHPLEGPLLGLVLALVLLPVLAAAIAYFTLAFWTQDPRTRFRILLVSGAFIGWFGSAALANALGWNAWYWWPLAARGIALAATLVVLLAFRPPGAVRARLDRAGPPSGRRGG